MKMRNIMQEEPPLPPQKRSVDRRCCTSLEIPRLGAVMREEAIGVMEVGDHDEPMGYEKPGDAVVDENRAPTQGSTCVAGEEDHEEDAEVRENDVLPLFGRE